MKGFSVVVTGNSFMPLHQQNPELSGKFFGRRMSKEYFSVVFGGLQESTWNVLPLLNSLINTNQKKKGPRFIVYRVAEVPITNWHLSKQPHI